MKYKVIAFINDIIIANKNNILCVKNIHDKNSDVINNPRIGDIEDAKYVNEWIWQYSKKDWAKMNREFSLLQLEK